MSRGVDSERSRELIDEIVALTTQDCERDKMIDASVFRIEHVFRINEPRFEKN